MRGKAHECEPPSLLACSSRAWYFWSLWAFFFNVPLVHAILPTKSLGGHRAKTVRRFTSEAHPQARQHRCDAETSAQIRARLQGGIKVVRPGCGAKVALSSLASDSRPFSCPSCGGMLSGTYDALRPRLAPHKTTRLKVVCRRSQSPRKSAANGGLVRKHLKARLALGRRRVEDARERYAQGRALYFPPCQCRYYVSQWFRATGTRLGVCPGHRG